MPWRFLHLRKRGRIYSRLHQITLDFARRIVFLSFTMKNPNKFPEAEMQDLARDAMRPDPDQVTHKRDGEAEKQTELKEMALAAKLENEACAALGVF